MCAMNRELRERALNKCCETLPTLDKAAVLLAGGTESQFMLYDSDTTLCPFRQEAYFRYLFCINEPDCFGVLDLSCKESLLFVPFQTDDSERWAGARRPLSFYKDKYGMDHVFLVDDLEKTLEDRGINHLYVLNGENTDSGAHTDMRAIQAIEGVKSGKFTLEQSLLHPLLSELRVFKTDKEIEYMRVSNLVSSQAHVYVMRHVKPGMTELQLEALFKAWMSYYGASRHVAYTCICCCGPSGSVLHYGHAGRPNDQLIQKGDMALLDMGGEYRGYASDITCSYPVDGVFTDDQKLIYAAVKDAADSVKAALKPGVCWVSMHRLAEERILEHLIGFGLVKGTVAEAMEAKLGAVFMPHGLGHLIGLNVHDVGGFTGVEREKDPGVCYLRTTRKMQKGMCITVEPGCYFGDPVLDKALANPAQAKHLDENILKRFRGFGGVRLEDDVVITEDGIDNLTVVPRIMEEIERVMGTAGS